MWKHIAANALTFLIVGLFLLAGVIAWGTNEYSAEGPLDQAICLQVRPGSNMRIVSEDLAEQAAISSPAIFRMGVDKRSSILSPVAVKAPAAQRLCIASV